MDDLPFNSFLLLYQIILRSGVVEIKENIVIFNNRNVHVKHRFYQIIQNQLVCEN